MTAAAFKPMLAKDGDPSNLSYPVVAQRKYDGIRASVVGGRLVSRTLKLIPNAEIREALERPEFEGLDGEIIVGDPTAADCYRRTASFVMSESKTGEPWAYLVFDKWDAEGGFLQRFADAEDIADSFGGEHVKSAPTTMIPNAEALEAYEVAALAEGHEGVILRTNPQDAPYKFGRSGKTGPLLKVKRHSDSEAVILGSVEEVHNANEAKTNALGRTERSSRKAGKIGKGRLGKLLVRDLYSGVEFSVGSGFTAQERADMWADRENLPGRTIRYKFFPIGIKDKPRHPVWEGYREGIDLPLNDPGDPASVQA